MIYRNIKLLFATAIVLFFIEPTMAQLYHEVASFSYSAELLRAGTIKANPNNSGIIYAAAQNVNSNFKGFFDAYDATDFTKITRTKRLGAGTDSFGVTDFITEITKCMPLVQKGCK